MLLLSLIYWFTISLLLWLILHIFEIKQFKWCVTNVWTIMHLKTHFLEFNFLDYDNVKPFKCDFFHKLKFGIDDIFWYDTKVHCMCLIHYIMAQTLSKCNIWMKFSNYIFLTYFQSTLLQCDQLANFAK